MTCFHRQHHVIAWENIPDDWHAHLLAHLERGSSVWPYRPGPLVDRFGDLVPFELMPVYGDVVTPDPMLGKCLTDSYTS